MNINNCVLSGRLTGDAVLKFTDTGMAVSNFRMAVNNRRRNKTTFINVVCFGKQAESLNEYLTKGTMVGVIGEIEISDYEKDGEKRSATSILANTIELGPKSHAE